jgi:hypothetical protein
MFRDIFINEVKKYLDNEELKSYLTNLDPQEIPLSKEFYMSYDPNTLIKRIKSLTIGVVNQEIRYMPLFK